LGRTLRRASKSHRGRATQPGVLRRPSMIAHSQTIGSLSAFLTRIMYYASLIGVVGAPSGCTSSSPQAGCTKDTDCAVGRICVADRCESTPSSMQSSGATGSAPSATGSASSATGSAQPAPSQSSVGGNCKTDADCIDSLCSPVSKICVRCTLDSHCPSRYGPQGHFCVKETCSGSCRADTDCQRYYNRVRCLRDNTCASCEKDSDCAFRTCPRERPYCLKRAGDSALCKCIDD
jgi:hypothetical protein